MPANLGNSTMATGLEKVSFHSKPKKRQCQRMLKLLHNALMLHTSKEIEENNRMGKTRDLFKKIRDTKGTFHAKMGSIKDRNGTDIREAEDINRWQEYTEELNIKDLHPPDNHNGVITHIESDILECEVK